MGQGRINNIKKYALEKKTMEMKGRGYGNKEIARILTEEAKVEINEWSVMRFFKEAKNTRALVKERQGNQLDDAKRFDNLLDDLEELKTALWKQLKNYSDNDVDITKTARAIQDNLSLIAKLLGALKQSPQTVYNVIDLAPKINNIMLEHKKNGNLICRKCGSTEIGFKPEVKGNYTTKDVDFEEEK